MQERLGRVRQIWQETSQTNRIMILAAGSVALVVAIVFLFWASSPEYAVLVSNAPSENAGKILAQLKEKKVPYRTNGGTIEVPAAQCDELRMSLATEGLMTTGSQGWNLLEKAPFGQTQAMETETIRHAHEVMMEHSIATLDAVASATVHFTDGDKSELFDADKKEGGASIIVRVKPGQDLTKENVRAIVALIQSGYSNIPARNINLVDGEGRLRWNGSEQASGLSSSDERQAQEARYSSDLTNKIQSYINTIVGPGKSTVMVRATLNLDKRVEKKHQVLPGVTTGKTTTTETLTGGTLNGQRPAIGPAGVAANTNGSTPPTYSGQDVNANSGKYNSESSTQTSQPSIVDSDTIEAPGEIKNAYVIVTLDKKIAPATAATLKQQIPIIMGEDPTAANPGVRVSVETADFDTKAQELDQKAAEAAASNERMNKMLGYGVPLGVMLLMLFLLSRAFRKTPVPAGSLLSLPGSQPALAMAGAGAGGQMGGLDILVGGSSPTGMNVEQALSGEGQIVAIGGDPTTHTYDVISESFDSNLESIMHLAKSKPETIALLLKTWQTEEKNR